MPTNQDINVRTKQPKNAKAVSATPFVKKIDEETLNEETSLLDAVQTLLRFHNIERSHASIRDVADLTKGSFDYKDAVSALQNMEFSANVGNITARKLLQGHCPSIIEQKDKKKSVLIKVTPKKEYIIFDHENKEKYTKYNYFEFKKIYSGNILLTKSRKQQRDDKKVKKVDWFWSS